MMMNFKKCIGCLLLLFPIYLGAQEPEIGAVYKAEGVYDLIPVNASERVQFLKGTKVYIVALDRNASTGKIEAVHFRGLPWSKTLEEPAKTIHIDEKDGKGEENLKYEEELKQYENNKALVEEIFKLSLSDFLLKFEKIKETDLKSRVNIGVLYQPIKLRVSREFSYETNVNFSASIAVTPVLHNEHLKYLSVVFAPGVTSVSLNPQNSNFFAQSQDIDEVTIPAFTFGIGLLLDASGAQFSVMFGADYLSYNKSIYGWKSQGALWISFGIGYNIFKASQPSEPSTQKLR